MAGGKSESSLSLLGFLHIISGNAVVSYYYSFRQGQVQQEWRGGRAEIHCKTIRARSTINQNGEGRERGALFV